MTLDDVARRCVPATTAQTIGRLETGTRTVSVGWLNRIAEALGVEAQDLVERGDAAELKVAAVLGAGGASAPRKAAIVVPPRAGNGQVAVTVAAGSRSSPTRRGWRWRRSWCGVCKSGSVRCRGSRRSGRLVQDR
jgi:hypothetical protein